jgi:hypothetical protein
MKTASPATSVLDEVTTWPAISTQPTPRGSTAIVFEGHELGHAPKLRRTAGPVRFEPRPGGPQA